MGAGGCDSLRLPDRDRPESASTQRRQLLTLLVNKAFDESDETYGHRRVHAQLDRWGEHCSPELVRAIMGEQGLVTCQPRPWRHNLTASDPCAGPIPDLVCRDFTAEAPGQKMVGDITYIPTWEGWLYLATVIDWHTKAVVGWATGDNYKTPLISAAIIMAARNHSLEPGVIFHSDRGSNYTSAEFADVLAALDLRQSVGRTGICFDNAMDESFFGALKNDSSTAPSIPPGSMPDGTLRGTSKFDTILNVFTQDSTTRPHSRSTTST